MNLSEFLLKRRNWQLSQKQFHERCYTCRRSKPLCYCHLIKSFQSEPQFVILIHPVEFRRRVATGRMAHLCLNNSIMIDAASFGENTKLQGILNNPDHHCVVLYPGENSVNLSPLSVGERWELFPKDKKLVIIVIDGTWNTASGMMRSCEKLNNLPRVCFSPRQASRFRIRKQPKDFCLSTIEAIHECIDLLNVQASSAHDHLLEVFDRVIDWHIELNAKAKSTATQKILLK